MYSIIRFYHPSARREDEVIKTGLTLSQASAHCSRDDTRKEGVYFDGYKEDRSK